MLEKKPIECILVHAYKLNDVYQWFGFCSYLNHLQVSMSASNNASFRLWKDVYECIVTPFGNLLKMLSNYVSYGFDKTTSIAYIYIDCSEVICERSFSAWLALVWSYVAWRKYSNDINCTERTSTSWSNHHLSCRYICGSLLPVFKTNLFQFCFGDDWSE